MTTSRLRRMTSFIVLDVLERAQELERQGIDVVHLEVGEPDFDAPACVKAAMCRALEDGHTHYTHSLGVPALREAICADYHRRYGVRAQPENVIVFPGTSPAMMALFAALLESGDETIIPDPHYACYPNFIKFVDGVPVTVPIYEADGFQYRPEAIAARITPRTKAIFINSPSNPTGNLLSAERMAAIAELGPYVISDEIYHGLVYEGEARSILEFTDKAFVLNGFSKLYAMTGFRLGYLIAPPAFVRAIRKIAQNFFISTNTAVQYAGLAALTDPSVAAETARMREVYNQRRLFMIKRLQEMGLGITVPPTGAFYVFANARHISADSYKLAFDILEKAHVGVTPGIDFGQGGEGYLRFSYANSMERIAEGMDRLERYLKMETT
ncbi:MAG TPA: pyridoxal phosphate-dependent aminotransferase [Desulfobacteraceae bacterium]|nr:pyridoxal phosphate-dependent aminotransferase [Deltaproteobacteria bacterium]HDI58910.1 pyridoxal phosphate-dependent aminotransferase [Desulfobacteraceae bacterium]